jgi:hypothetical protein
MIEAAQPITQKRQGHDPLATGLVRSPVEDTAAPAAVTGAPEVKVAERQQAVTPTHAPLDPRVTLDGDTMRVYTEIVDPENDKVIKRIPGGYEPVEEDGPKLPASKLEA